MAEPTPPPWQRLALWAAAALLLGVWGWRTATHAGNEGDLRVYYDVVSRLDRGLDLYQHLESDGHPTGYIYPPPFALAFRPLTALPFPWVRWLWFVASGLLAVRLGEASWSLLVRGGRPPRPLLALALGLLPGLRFALSDLGHGQVNLLVAALAVEGVLQGERRREGLGGLLLAAACAIKLTPGILVLGALAAGRRRLVGWSALWLAALLALPALLGLPGAGADALWRFASVITPWNAAQHGAVGNNASLSSLILRLGVGVADPGQTPRPLLFALPAAPVRALASALGAALLLGFAWASARVPALRRDGGLRAGLGLATIPLVSPVAWKPHLVALLLPGLLAGALLQRPGRARWPLGAGLLLLGASGREVLGRAGSDGFALWGGLTLGTAALAAGLLLAALEQGPGPEPAAGEPGTAAPAAAEPPTHEPRAPEPAA